MPVLEPVVATLTVNTAEFTAGLDEAKAQMAEFGAGADLAGTEGDLTALGASGKQAGADIADGATLAAGGLRDAEGAASDAEGGLRDTESAAEDAGKAAEDSGGKFSLLSNIFGNLPGPIGDVSSKTKEFRGTIEDAGESSGGFASILGDIPVPAVIATAAIAGVAAVSVDLASKYQTVTNQIAASEGITTGAATKIGQAFLTTAGQTTQSAQQIATAFAGVAGQAKQINGSALSAQQSLDLMTNAIDLAEASGTNLTSATSSLVTVMQTFTLGIKSASDVTNTLYTVANATGQSIGTVASSIDRMKSTLGGIAPPLQQIGGLLIDLQSHGETGRKAMSALNTAFTAFLKPATAVATAQNNLKVAFDALPASLQPLAKGIENGTVSYTAADKAAQALGYSQYTLMQQFTTAAGAVTTASQATARMGISALDANGKLKPMSDIIGQLQAQIKGLTPAQAAARLSADGFGSSAAKLVSTIQAGPAAYEKYLAEVEKTNAAHSAAQKATAGMDASFEKAKAAIEDAGVALGEKLMPYVTEAAQEIAKFAALIVQDWPQISAVIKVAFDIIIPIIKGFIDQIKGIIEIITGLVDFVKDIFTGKWGAAWDAVKKIFAGVLEDLKGLLLQQFGPLAGIVQKGLADIVGFFERLPGQILGGLSSLGGILGGFFSSVWGGIRSGITSAWGDIVAFFTGIPGDILDALASFGGLLQGWITSVWNTFKAWIEAAWTAEVAFWTAIPSKLISAVEALGGLLEGWISAAWNGFKSFIEFAWNAEVEFWSEIPAKIVAALASLGGDLLAIGGSVMGSLASGVSGAWKAIAGWFAQLPGNIVSAIGNVVDLLYDAGKTIIASLGRGIEDGVKDVYNFVSGIAGKIASLKGPAAVDAVLLTENGQLIMQGFAKGLQGGWASNVVPTLQGMTTALGGGLTGNVALGTGGTSAGGIGAIAASAISPIAASGGGNAGGGTTVLNVTTPVQVAGQTLAQIVTQYQLKGARATGSVLGQYSGTNQSGAATGINTNAIAR